VWSFGLWGACCVIRLTLILVFKPVLDFLGRPVSFGYCLVMAWGGLRGAIGLALGMVVVSGHDGFLTDKDAKLMLFHIGLMATWTLIINATTCGALVRYLGLNDVSDGRKVLLVFTKRRLHNICDQLLQDINRYVFEGKINQAGEVLTVDTKQVIFPVVESMSAAMKKSLHEELHRFIRTAPDDLNLDMSKPEVIQEIDKADQAVIRPEGTTGTVDFNTAGPGKADAHIRVLREMFLNAIRAKYWEKVNKGQLEPGSDATDVLLTSVNVGFDHVETGLRDFDHIEAWITHRKPAKPDPNNTPACDRLARTRLQMICTFLEAHEEAQCTTTKNFGHTGMVESKEENMVIHESDTECAKAIHHLMDIHLSVLEEYKTSTVIRLFTNSLLHRVESLVEKGILAEKEEELFHHMFSHKMAGSQKQFQNSLLQELKTQREGVGYTAEFRPKTYSYNRAIGEAYDSPGDLLLGMVEWFDFIRGFGHHGDEHGEDDFSESDVSSIPEKRLTNNRRQSIAAALLEAGLPNLHNIQNEEDEDEDEEDPTDEASEEWCGGGRTAQARPSTLEYLVTGEIPAPLADCPDELEQEDMGEIELQLQDHDHEDDQDHPPREATWDSGWRGSDADQEGVAPRESTWEGQDWPADGGAKAQ